MPNVAYRINLVGMEQAIAGLKAVHGSAYSPPSVSESWGKFSSKLDHVSDSAKKVARDMDATGNKVAESSLKAIDNITGLAAAMAAGPFSLVGAIGLVVGGWAAYNSITSRAAEIDREAKAAVDALMASTRAMAEQQINLNEADSKQLKHRQDVVDLTITQNALNLQAMHLNVMGFRMMAAEQRRGLNSLSLSDPTGAKRFGELMQTIDTLKGLEAGYTKAVGEQEKLRTEAADLRYRRIGALVDEDVEHRKAAAKKSTDDEAAEFARGEAAFYKTMDARARRFEADKKERERIRLEEEKEVQDVIDAENKDIEAKRQKDIAHYKALGDAALESADKQKRLVSEITSLSAALQYVKNVSAPTFSAGMMVIDSAMSVTNKYLEEFGQINRDNWRDLLNWSKDKQAAFAAEAQAALWSLARQAAPKAVFENAEGIASAAAAAGEYGKGNVAGGVLLTAAAVGHYAASAAYGTIAVAAGGASLAIGSQRGSGGMFAAAPGGGSPSPSGGGPSGGGGGGGGSPTRSRGGGGDGSGGGGGVSITYVYEAGSINANDERATARTVTRAVGNARGSWHERRLLDRRT
jgi:hypothetical protein